MVLATNYAQQNWYCFAVDIKGKPLFRTRMHLLASCFPNVFLTQRELPIAGEGFNTSDAMMECAKELGVGPTRKTMEILHRIAGLRKFNQNFK
jgi:hypothetical protein